jgi:hypothetical protein
LPKKTFEYAAIAGATLITQVKENQKSLLHQIKHGCRVQKPVSEVIDDWEKAHGRLEQRCYEVFDALPMLKNWNKEWPHIVQIIRVTRHRERLRVDKKPSQEVSYYVSNAPLTKEKYGQYIRQHWFVENKLHHVKDVAFQEDKTVKRVNPFIFSTCIDFSLNRLRAVANNSNKQKIYRASLDIFKFLEDNKLLELISTP